MDTFTSASTAETEQLGERWAHELGPDWIIGLSGDLGAGKTHLVRGLARGWGFTGRVHSPTFALLHRYDAPAHPVYHLDLYRLSSPDEILASGLEEYLVRPDGPSVIEWFERWAATGAELPAVLSPKPPRRCRRVWIDVLTPDRREIRYEDSRA